MEKIQVIMNWVLLMRFWHDKRVGSDKKKRRVYTSSLEFSRSFGYLEVSISII